MENDLLGDRKDRFYTNGTELSYTREGPPPSWLETLAGHTPFFRRTERVGVIYSLGQQVFTPQDTSRPDRIVDDRPYAGWLFGSAAVVSSIAKGARSDEGNALELMVGIVGPASRADDLQTAIHKRLGNRVPRGWANQLENEPGLVLSYVRKRRYFSGNLGDAQFEIGPHLAGAVGNVYTYAAAGTMVRYGTNLREDVGPAGIRPGFPGSSFFAPREGGNWYVFMGVEARAIARNIFLDGNTFADSPRIKKEPFVGDFQFGVAYRRHGWRIAWSNVVRSKEYEGQRERARFGAVSFAFHVGG